MFLLQDLWTRSSDLGHDGSSTGKGWSGKSRHVHPGMSTPDVSGLASPGRADHIHVDVFPTPVVIVRGRGGKVPLQDANDIFERRRDDRHHRRRSLRCCKTWQSKFFLSRARPSDISSASRLNDTVCEEARKETQCRWRYRSER